MSVGAQPDFVTIVISRKDIEAGDVSGTLSALSKFLNPEAALVYCEKLDIGVHGYDDDPRELNEVQDVRDFVYKLDAEFPYWCYFLSKRTSGLMFILSCFCAPFVVPEVRDRIWRDQIADYLTRRGFPAMNHLGETIGCSETEIERMTQRVMDYILTGIDRSEV